MESPTTYTRVSIMSYGANAHSFERWLKQPVWVADHKEKRSVVIRDFHKSLTYFMKKNGYIMDSRWNNPKVNYLTNWMYRIWLEEHVRFNRNKEVYVPPPIHRNTEEDYDYFSCNIDVNMIGDFMKEWSFAEDFDSDSSRLAYRMEYELQDFLYNFVDLELSKHGRTIARIWDDSGSDSDDNWNWNSKHHDIYLRDASDGFHGGRGSKV
jgi:hypothetical protein